MATPRIRPPSRGSKAEGALAEDCRHRRVPYLNNALEQDHRAIKQRVNASQGFRSSVCSIALFSVCSLRRS
jgi:transposase-like protein